MKNNDSVGEAIAQIKLNLSHLSQQHDESSWVQKGKSILSNILRGDKKPEEFANDFFDFSFQFLSCNTGTFYFANNDHELFLIKSFGSKYPPASLIKKSDPFYYNIVRQGKPVVLKDIKSDFFKVDTSFGTLEPVSVLIIPLIMNSRLVGLIELGKLTQIGEAELNFISETLESIAIYLSTLLGKQELEKLLASLDLKEQELQNQIKAINRAALVIEFDTSGKILNANELFCQNMGYSLEELLGKHHRIFVEKNINYEKEYATFWESLASGNISSGEFCRIDKNGNAVWLQASYNPVTDNKGNIYKILKIGYNITEMKLQRQQLESVTLKMNQQLEVLNRAAIVSETDADGNIIFVNDFFCQISEYTREELIGKNHRILKSGKQPQGLFKGMWKAISSGLLWQGEILNKSKNGNYYWVETSIMPFKDKDGKIEKYVAVRFDITKQKESEALKRQTELLMASQRDLESANTELEAQAQKLQASEEELRVQQEELMQSNKELEEKTKLLEERNIAYNEKNNLLIAASADLRKKAEQLELSSKYKSEFLANMSHELRTPLNSILLLSKLMTDNIEGNLSDDQIEYASVINKAGTSLLELINDILDLSKIESGKMDVNAEFFALKDFEKEIFDLFHPISSDKSIEFKVNIRKECPETIFTDKLRIGQVVKNLLSNAFKFSPNGKVDLNISMDKKAEMISFSVVDNGIGIPKEKQSLVFEAFRQADGSTRRKYGGTGLGLSISREIAHLLGGEIKLESEPGKGSDFTITIPVQYSADRVSDRKSKNDNSPLAQLEKLSEEINPETEIPSLKINDDRDAISAGDNSILIVEDDIYFLQILQSSARNSGYKVIATTNGKDAIELASKFIPKGIILDLHLPIKSGWEVLKELKDNSETKNIPVHIVSSQDFDSKKAREQGAVAFTNKPISESGLQKLFESLTEISAKQNGKIALFFDKEEHRSGMSSFLSEKNLEAVAFDVNNGDEFPEDFAIFDAIIIDIDSRKSAIPNLLEKLKERVSVKTLPVVVLSNTYLSVLDTKRINKYQNEFLLKIAKSYTGIIDEISLFLSFVSRESNAKKMRPTIVSAKVLEDKKILLVDDDEENRYSIGKLMELQKAKVIHARNGKEALEKFAADTEIDAVLMDIMMPEMDGYEATREIRKMPSGMRVPIIALTAKTQPDERENCLKNGASDYMPKPIDPDLLVSLLKVWINQNEKK